MITILLADAQPVVREGIRAWLREEVDLRVVAEASSGVDACDLAERLQPAVAVLEVALPLLDGLEAARQIRARARGCRVVVFSRHDNEPCVLAALQAGAVAYVSKGAGAAELVHAIREAAAGRRYLPEPFYRLAVEAYQGKERLAGGLEGLTPRERQVLYLVAQGHTSAEIGRLLFISGRTVEGHRARIIAKLGLHGAAGLVRYAIAHCLSPGGR